MSVDHVYQYALETEIMLAKNLQVIGSTSIVISAKTKIVAPKVAFGDGHDCCNCDDTSHLHDKCPLMVKTHC